MEKDTILFFNSKMSRGIQKFSNQLKIKAKKLEVLNDECEKLHDRLWNAINKHPDVNIERNIYTYDYTNNELIYRGPKPDVEDMIKEVLTEIFEHTSHNLIELSNRTEH